MLRSVVDFCVSDLNNDHYCSELESGSEEHVLHTDYSSAFKALCFPHDQDPSPSLILSSIILFHGDIDFIDDIMHADGAGVHLDHIGERRKRESKLQLLYQKATWGDGLASFLHTHTQNPTGHLMDCRMTCVRLMA